MSPAPNRLEFDIGVDRYQRRSRLIAEREGGQVYWSIVSAPVAQRDDGEHIRSLTTPQLREIAEIVKEHGGR